MRKKSTPNTLWLANMPRKVMPPTTMPVIIMLSGPIMAATSLKAKASGSGSRRRANSVIRPAAIARMFGFSNALRMPGALSPLNMRTPTVQNSTLKTRMYALV